MGDAGGLLVFERAPNALDESIVGPTTGIRTFVMIVACRMRIAVGLTSGKLMPSAGKSCRSAIDYEHTH